MTTDTRTLNGDRPMTAMGADLSRDHERAILDAITSSSVSFDGQGYQAQATLAWVGEFGRVYFGACRSARTQDDARRYSVTPFPGAWVEVTEDAILTVVAGVPVPEYGQPSVTLASAPQLTRVAPEEASRHGLVPWNLCGKGDDRPRD